MKGHGPYVWASYVITLVGIVFLAAFPRLQRKQLFKLMRANKLRQEAGANTSTSNQPSRELESE
ncbi:MAG: heme exporter protein CcmD [Cellvibrionaceae bacterium]|nr:heme exporter protein CcmD [Cellvibrionaceae bacterium]